MEDTKEIFENFKEQVRHEADIVRIISEYVPLKKKGGRYWGCCPFHGEKTPSFTVDEGKGLLSQGQQKITWRAWNLASRVDEFG